VYNQITHHGRRIITCLQTPQESARFVTKGDGTVVPRAGVLRASEPRLGVEIGVQRGYNAATLLARMPNLHLYLVDHWGQTPEEVDADPVGHRFYQEALEKTSFAKDRITWIRRASPAAASLCPDSLDFVFVDGDHLYEACLADCRAWWPKIRAGGVLFGHDIDNPDPKFADWGVRRAAEVFAKEVGCELEVYPYPEMVFVIKKPSAA